MSDLSFEQERFDMGRVVSRTFGAISRNLPLYFTLAVVLLFIPGLILQLLAASTAGANPLDFSTARVVTIIVLGVANMFLLFIMSAAVSYATVMDQNGERVGIGPALKIGLQRAFPLLLLAFCSLIGIYFGLILLLVPGIMFGIWWSVATPVLVNENLGVFASMSRSKALTKGSRWAIFGLFFVAVILLFVPVMLVPLMTGALANPELMAANQFSAAALISQFMSALLNMVFAALIAAVYVELRTIKEGATSESLAAIFA